jgi:hypothetical protein
LVRQKRTISLVAPDDCYAGHMSCCHSKNDRLQRILCKISEQAQEHHSAKAW